MSPIGGRTNSVTFDPGSATEPTFRDPDQVMELLAGAAYLADERIATAIFVADVLGKPILCEGPAGVGKTELAKSVAAVTGRRLIRLQCYEGIDESKALYEWNYKKQLLRIQAEPEGAEWEQTEADIFDEDFLLERPLLAAIRSPDPVVLLIDEVDRIEVETEALLLEVLSDFQVSVPELGTIVAASRPSVFLTSNNTRELSEALKRRCVFLDIDYPSIEREQSIIEARIPGITQSLAANCAEVVSWIRSFELKKPPSVSETLDWARTLLVLGRQELSRDDIRATLNLLLKYSGDIDKVADALKTARA
jgi:MoxR-like ATPase